MAASPTSLPTPLTSPSPSLKSQRSQWHNGSRSLLHASVPDLVKKLTKLEKIRLLAGADWWHTAPIGRLDIPGVKMSDGPNGVRGASFAEMTAGLAIPCETALAATFSPELVHSAACLLARESKDRGAVALLAPTVNIQRSPLGGRAFESFSEDPGLSGLMASAYIRGLQENGVSAVLKHFVCNDQEHERSAVSAEVSERALREVYMRPFMLAVKEGKPLAIMTSYNRVNGTHVADSKELLETVLRQEWGFQGMIMSDWFGTYSVDLGIIAGLDLEMPGPAKWRTQYLVDHMLASRKITQRQLDSRVENVLDWAQKLARMSPDVIYGDDIETTHDNPEDRAILRKVATAAVVLLKNEGGVLPIRKGVKSIAVIGPRAVAKSVFGGGSAQLNTSYVVTVLEGLQEGAPKEVSVQYSLGTPAHKLLPYLDPIVNESGEPGCNMGLFRDSSDTLHRGHAVRTLRLCSSSALISDDVPEELEGRKWYGSLTGTWTSPINGLFEFSLSVCGRAKLYIDDEMVIDNWNILQTPGEGFFGQGTQEEKGVLNVSKERKYRIRCEYSNVAGPAAGAAVKDQAQPIHNFGLRLGGFPVTDLDKAMEEAVELAESVDAVMLAVGLSPDFESESYDRPDLSLPSRTNELIERAVAVNPRTIVALQSGSAVNMPWIDKVPAVLQAWYGGNESGNAIADIIYGRVNPSGRLPITLPRRDEDVPAYTNFKSHQGLVRYAEDLSVGYKWYQARKIEPLFAFGHGLSYSTFIYSDLQVSSAESADDIELSFTFDVTNNGQMAGSHSAQLYLAPPPSTSTSLYHPEHSLGGIASLPGLSVGETRSATIKVDKRGLAHWDDIIHSWTVEEGKWSAWLSTDSLGPRVCAVAFNVEQMYEWLGL